MSTDTKKPFVLGLDLDGVVGDYTAAFRPVVAQIKGQSIESMPDPVDFALWNCPGWNIKDKADYTELHRIALNEFHIYRDMPVYEGAIEHINQLVEMGVRIKIVTTRLFTKGDYHKVLTDTSIWLEKNNIPFDEICFVRDKPAVGAHLYIDDAPHNITEIQSELGHDSVIIYDQPWNQGIEGIRAVSDVNGGRIFTQWDHLVGMIPAMAAMKDYTLTKR